MIEFSSVNKACDFLVNKTGKHWEAKFYIYDGERFYFIWSAFDLPFNQRQNSLICRGNKKTVLAKLERIANAPILPQLPTKTFYRQTASGSVIQWDEPGENF